MNLSTQQSGRFRGVSRLSKYGNARLRTALWMAAQGAVRMRENSLRRKFTAMCAAIRSTPTGGGRPTTRSPPSLRGSFTA
jgi:transposase